VGGGRVFQEKASGAKRERPQLARLLASLSPGDVVLVTRLDRLARSTRDLLNVLGAIADKGAMFRRWATPGPTPPRRMGGSCSRCWVGWPSSSAS
jgi:DNA invertase Pin-like site-specific DNA recombinase